ncbi:hypothetical protein BABINDRAFT_161309 [Babjeviella inositovora NRRL Y-12698]|uniref:Endoplasmic reticulum-Golgi intermediate compartment protein n=1 Tax=Babjeviella inositovora NRRL Y-12698 TaxID=984486 RepID=A0A1E3QRN3_9ASCO|nr:uncharacterized protein BABINDRAFT_161309 [Babjeviella inositovora NRRL Y-12698]ODQ80359.1 hypothetical protein BABINDRAFT_161309 [Babjeviella inositovora NRRL Y-12698]
MARPGPKLLSLDLFAKTVEDARVRTTSGGLITLSCLCLVVVLLFSEYRLYQQVVNRPELVVDRDHQKKLPINMDITFPHLPCGVLTLDILEEGGNVQLDLLQQGFQKLHLSPEGVVVYEEDVVVNQSLEEMLRGVDAAGNCGSCYGALDQLKNDEKEPADKICCNSCLAVRKAYTSKPWAFYDGENIAQCESEGYVSRIKDNLTGGCRIVGSTNLGRLRGNFHFAPGASFSSAKIHSHDLSLYQKYEDMFNFDHIINHLSFGPKLSEKVVIHASQLQSLTSTHPLDGFEIDHDKKFHTYSYHLKIVPTRYEFLASSRLAAIETNQFTVAQHDRPISGGRDEDHPNTVHLQGGLPGVFFNFEVGPLKVINKEAYGKTWSGFVLGVVSGIGGVVCLGVVLDKGVWAVGKVLKDKKDT